MENKDRRGQKVLIISSEFPPGPGGIGNHAYNLAKFLQEENLMKVTVLADTNFTSSREIGEFDKLHSFKITRIYRYRLIFLTYLKRIVTAGILISQNDRIICSGKFPLWVGGLFKGIFKSKKEFIAIVHGSELDIKSKWPRRFTDYSIKKFKKIISVSKYTQGFLPPVGQYQKRTIIPNGIDLDEFLESSNTETRHTKTENFNLLTVGNVTPRKGQKNLIRALPEIVKYFPNIHYHIVGLPTHKEAFESFANELGVDRHVTFHGKVSRKDLLKMYKNCDVFVMLSDHTNDGDFEGFGIAVLEANLWKKPAIGSRNSGIADAIDDKKTGVLVDQHNDKEIADALLEIHNNYERYSEQAFQWAVDHDWRKVSEKYHSFITEPVEQ